MMSTSYPRLRSRLYTVLRDTPRKVTTSPLVWLWAISIFFAISSFAGGSFVSLLALSHLPAATACNVFSWGVTHSRLAKAQLRRFESLWFTCSLPKQGGKNALATNLCTSQVSWTLPGFGYLGVNTTNGYPGGVIWCFLMRPLTTLRPPPRVGTTLSRDLTRPWSLTSYNPSNPTTGSRFSLSIFHLYTGLLPSLRLVTRRLTPASLETALLPFVSVLREPRPVNRPTPGAFPTLGLGCRS